MHPWIFADFGIWICLATTIALVVSVTVVVFYCLLFAQLSFAKNRGNDFSCHSLPLCRILHTFYSLQSFQFRCILHWYKNTHTYIFILRNAALYRWILSPALAVQFSLAWVLKAGENYKRGNYNFGENRMRIVTCVHRRKLQKKHKNIRTYICLCVCDVCEVRQYFMYKSLIIYFWLFFVVNL